MPAARRTRLPSIYVDEHLESRIAAAFKPTFRLIEAARSNRIRGRDERDFISELYRENAILVTSDAEFVNESVDDNVRHAGIIYVPTNITLDEKINFAEIVRDYIVAACRSLPFAFRGVVLYPGYDGLHTIRNKTDKMEFSWTWLSQLTDGRP
jgi:predicted nuclease of predicted toxin-antitoxin system